MLMFWTEAADTEASELMRAEPFACRPATVQVIEHRQARIMAVGVNSGGRARDWCNEDVRAGFRGIYANVQRIEP